MEKNGVCLHLMKGETSMTTREIEALVDDINDTCSIAQIPAKYGYNEKYKSFECASELVPDQMLLPITRGLSESEFYTWTEKCNVLVMDKWSEIYKKS